MVPTLNPCNRAANPILKRLQVVAGGIRAEAMKSQTYPGRSSWLFSGGLQLFLVASLSICVSAQHLEQDRCRVWDYGD